MEIIINYAILRHAIPIGSGLDILLYGGIISIIILGIILLVK